MLEGEQARLDAREQPGEVEGVGGEGDEGAKAEWASHVGVDGPHILLARVAIVRNFDARGGATQRLKLSRWLSA